jgi:hypothetical protein
MILALKPLFRKFSLEFRFSGCIPRMRLIIDETTSIPSRNASRASLCFPVSRANTRHFINFFGSLQLCSTKSLFVSWARYATVGHRCPHFVTWLYWTDRRRTKRGPRTTDFSVSDVTSCAQPIIKRDINGNVKTWITTARIELSISVCEKQWEINRSVTQWHNCPHSPSYKCDYTLETGQSFLCVACQSGEQDNRGSQKPDTKKSCLSSTAKTSRSQH